MKQGMKLLLVIVFLVALSALYRFRKAGTNGVAEQQVLPSCPSNSVTTTSAEPEDAGDTPTDSAIFDGIASSQEQAAVSVRHPEEDDALLDIANMRIPLLFTATKMAQETEQVIAADLSLLLSGVEHLEWVPEIPPRQWRDVIITHELRGWQAKELPDIIKECFGAVTTVDDVRYLVIPDELVDSYRKSLEIKRRHPDMCNRLNEFIALLEDSQALGALASDAANADRMVHCYKTSRKEGLRVLEEYASLNMNVRQPSLLDIKPFSEVVGEEDEVGDVFVVSSVITWNDKRTGAPRQQKLPLGIYVDNRWRVLSFPMP